MKIKELRDIYHKETGKISNLARSTNYSLIAICWILCGQNLDKLKDYICVLFFLLLSLGFDYLQYLFKGVLCGIIYKYKECKATKAGHLDDEKDVGDYPEWMPWVTWAFFTLKYVFSFIAVSILLYQIYKNFYTG